jgi:Zn-dependent peptidase ImmA (M78 family)
VSVVPRKAIATAKAREVIRNLNILEPDEIDVEAIANYYNVGVRLQRLSGMDGCILRKGDNAVITVREDIRYIPQQRFVIAHELGHYFLHPNTRQAETVSQEQTSNWSEKNVEEYEANLFAADLLMPPQMFAQRHSEHEPSLGLIESLAREFSTTLTSTAVQFTLSTREECAIVVSKNRQRIWAMKSPGFSFQLLEDGYVHGHSCAEECRKIGQPARSDQVEASFWLKGFFGDHKSAITEDSRYFTRLQRTLTLLWIHEQI